MGLNTYSTDLESSSSQYWSITDASQTGLDLSGDLTFEAWIKPESVSGNDHILAKYVTSGNQRAYRFNLSNNGAGNFTVNLSGNGASGTTCAFSSNNSVITTGTWQHVAFTYEASTQTGQLYLDGSSVTTNLIGTAPTSIKNSTAPFLVGSYKTGTANFFDGLIDEVRVWNVERTSGEISANYNTELVGNESGLVGYWRFNNDATDQTSNGNDLTNNNSATFSTDVPFTGAAGAVDNAVIFAMNF